MDIIPRRRDFEKGQRDGFAIGNCGGVPPDRRAPFQYWNRDYGWEEDVGGATGKTSLRSFTGLTGA